MNERPVNRFDLMLTNLMWACFWLFALIDLAVGDSGLGIPALVAFVAAQWMEWLTVRRPSGSSVHAPRSRHG